VLDMLKELEQAINLRQLGKLDQSNQMLVQLVEQSPKDAFINYQCAWSFDVLGQESKAVPFYEEAIQLGLAGKDLEGAIVGLGSTYRTLGLYEKSKTVFLKGLELFPSNKAIQVFYSMTLYNLNEHNKAMELMLKCIAGNTTDPDILNYKKAIHFYSDKLDQVWDT